MSVRSPDEWIDEAILAGESRSVAGWRARAIGMPVRTALRYVPRRGLLQTSVPIDAFRQLQAHIRSRGESQAVWLRRAVVAAFLAQGGDQLVAFELGRIPPPGGPRG